MIQLPAKKTLRLVLAQLNFCVGDIAGNLQKHLQAAHIALDRFAADLIVFPELSLTGYLPEDLLLRQDFITTVNAALQTFILHTRGIYCLVGHPSPAALSAKLWNQCSLIYNQQQIAQYTKQSLPNRGVFDEKRYFLAGDKPFCFMLQGIWIGVLICEDVWHRSCVATTIASGVQLLIILNASPFEQSKHEQRVALLQEIARCYAIPIVYVNHVGGQDEIVFDGGSIVLDAQGCLCQFAGFFHEALCFVEIEIETRQVRARSQGAILDTVPRVYEALTLAVYDYVRKNHFHSVLIGLSGGIDSALTCSIAVDALGSAQVHAVMMSSRYTTRMSCEDAALLAQNLKVHLDILSIEPIYTQCLSVLAPVWKQDSVYDIVEQNCQARCRALLLLALSNQFHHLVLNTSNRSEIAVGYCTLYGDTAGGFAVLKDIPKTLVYQLALYRNQRQWAIPQRIIQRAPTAELAMHQQDTDSLPPYSLLDPILESYLNQKKGIDEIVEQGFDRVMVTDIVHRILKNEYKRRQIAIGPRINHQAFGRDRRYPITNGFEG